jgi:hypothetical protein
VRVTMVTGVRNNKQTGDLERQRVYVTLSKSKDTLIENDSSKSERPSKILLE